MHIMAYRQEERIAEIVEKTKVLGDRTPWHPQSIIFGEQHDHHDYQFRHQRGQNRL